MNLDKTEFNEKYMDNSYFFPACYNMAGVIAHSFHSSDIEDYKQQAVLRCFTKRHLYNPETGKAFSYFYRIIHNEFRYCIREELRKMKGVKLTEIDGADNKSSYQDWILINKRWFTIEEIQEIFKQEGTRYRAIKRIKEITNE